MVISQVIHTAIQYKPNITWNDETKELTFTGNFIKLGEVVNHCSKVSAAKINVFAIYKVFFDRDLDQSNQQVQVCIISPEFEMVSNVSVTLNGNDAQPLCHLEQIIPELGKDGVKGRDGNPGMNSGKFFGGCFTFTDNKRLTISANGGNGGGGERGGDGGSGREEETIHISDNTNNIARDIANAAIVAIPPDNIFKVAFVTFAPIIASYFTKNETRNIEGVTSGKSGIGGLGGQGGSNGEVLLINFSNNSCTEIFSQPGICGERGANGLGIYNPENSTTEIEMDTTFYLLSAPYLSIVKFLKFTKNVNEGVGMHYVNKFIDKLETDERILSLIDRK